MTTKIAQMDGIVPLSKVFDSLGPMAKSTLDVANILDAIIDPTKTTIPHGGFANSLSSSWKGIRIGVLDPEKWFFSSRVMPTNHEAHKQIVSSGTLFWKIVTLTTPAIYSVMRPEWHTRS
jgi:amidase